MSKEFFSAAPDILTASGFRTLMNTLLSKITASGRWVQTSDPNQFDTATTSTTSITGLATTAASANITGTGLVSGMGGQYIEIVNGEAAGRNSYHLISSSGSGTATLATNVAVTIAGGTATVHPTIYRVPFAGTYHRFIFKMNDALVSSGPSPFAFEIGMGKQSAAAWQYRYTLLIDTDGSGNYVPLAQFTPSTGLSGSTASVSSLKNCMISADTFRLQLALFTDYADPSAHMVSVTRSHDSSGNQTGEAAHIAFARNVNVFNQRTLGRATSPSVGIGPLLGSPNCEAYAAIADTTNFGATLSDGVSWSQSALIHRSPRAWPFARDIIVMHKNDRVDYGEYQYNGDTYIDLGPQITPSGISNGRLAMRWN